MGTITKLAGRIITDAMLDLKGYADQVIGFKWILSLIPEHVSNANTGTSQSSVAIGTGNKSFVFTNANGQVPSFKIGALLKLSDVANPAVNWMIGSLTVYDDTAGNATVSVSDIGGSGTIANWTINLTGLKGAAAGAPDTSPFVTVAADAALANERAARGQRGVRLVDGGGGNFLDIEADRPATIVATTTYTVTAADRGSLLRFTHASGCAVTLPTAGGTVPAGFHFDYVADGGAVTYTPSSGTIRGASSLVARAGSMGTVISDGTNWQAMLDTTAASLAANTFTGKQTLMASTTVAASLSLPSGVAPSSPANDDIWATASGIFHRLAGATKRLLNTDDVVPVFQCRLTKSGSNLLLSREGGKFLFINGVNETIPSAGVQLSPSGAGTGLLYIYARMNAGSMELAFSATAPAIDSTYGHPILSGDATRVLVGMAYASSNAWVDSATQRLVLSYYNRRNLGNTNTYATSGFSTSGAFSNWGTAQEFLCWGDHDVPFEWECSGSPSSGTEALTTNVSLDNAASGLGGLNAVCTASSSWVGAGASSYVMDKPSRGRHTLQPRSSTPGATGWSINYVITLTIEG